MNNCKTRKLYPHSLLIAGLCWAALQPTAAAAIENVPAALETVARPAANEDTPMAQSPGEDKPLSPEDILSDADRRKLFGAEGGYFHPYFSLSEQWTDNLFHVRDGEKSNLLTKASPGFWVSVPRTKEIPVDITPHNTSPGGLQQQLKDHSGTDRYQLYALGGLDFLNYSEDSNLNSVEGNFEGLARYNMRGGLSLQLLDRYSKGHDWYEIGGIAPREQLPEYDSNIVMGTVDWQLTEKVRVKADYSNFVLDYDDDILRFLNRDDDVVDFYGYYVYSEKTSFFIQYSLIDVTYDIPSYDNEQNYLYGGIKWDTTEKLSFMVKAGQQQKDYDSPSAGYEEYDGLAFDLQTSLRFREKSAITLNVYRKNEETDSAVAVDKEVTGGRFGYFQQYTDKIVGKLDVRYENADYRQVVSQDREDTRLVLRPAVQYLFREWLMAEMAYSYDTRDSNDDSFDFDANTLFLTIHFAI